MNAPRKLSMVAGVALLALALFAGPVAAADDAPADEAPAEETEGQQEADQDARPAVAQTPRDQLGLLLLGALVIFAAGGAATFRRQQKGDRPQATGEFRWR